MRYFTCIIIFLLTIDLFFCQKSSSWQEVKMLVKTIKQQHYAAREIDDRFSRKLFNNFISNLDPYHFYLLKSEYLELSKFKYSLDEELNTGNAAFINRVEAIYLKALKRASKMLTKLASKEFSTLKDVTYVPYGKDSLAYADSEAEIQDRWGRYLKLSVHIKEYLQGRDSLSRSPQKQEIFQKVTQKYLHHVDQSLKDSVEMRANLYYKYAKELASLFDAHTSYLSYKDFQDFQSSLSTHEYAFGVIVNRNNLGLMEVLRLTPGSPAWKSNKLNKGDVITHLQWEGEELVELADLDEEEIFALIDKSNEKHLYFTVRSTAGFSQVLALKKEQVTSSENVVKGYVLTGNDGTRVGYIALPSFYKEWDSEGVLGCAHDVAKELLKLQNEKIDGFILDLRNNGGGSLKEGVELAGLFVNEGALAIGKSRAQGVFSMKDAFRGTVYAGPMLVMVNGHSASASELAAAALQDHQRAVIVGTKTYGKATGQELIYLGEGSADTGSTKFGFVSLTNMKLYRVTGRSNQIIGVRPDITLIDPYLKFYETEADQEEALPADSVVKKVYYQPLAMLPLERLKKNSAARIANDPLWQSLQKLSSVDVEDFDIWSNTVSLNKEGIGNFLQPIDQWNKTYRTISNVSRPTFKVANVDLDHTLLQLSEEDRVMAKEHIKMIQNDYSIEECYHILEDLVRNK